jgi:hypothetical protein
VNSGPLFDSPWLKWGHAIEHARVLQSQIAEVETLRDPLLSVRTEHQPRRHGFAVYAGEVRDVPEARGLLVGDIAFNYRCALDRLAWAVVTRCRTPSGVMTSKSKVVSWRATFSVRPAAWPEHSGLAPTVLGFRSRCRVQGRCGGD